MLNLKHNHRVKSNTTITRFISIIVPIFLSSCSVLLDASNYDEFVGHQLSMESDKNEYNIGDDITLVASITPRESTSIRLYRDRRGSFSIFLRARKNGEIDFSDNDFYVFYEDNKDDNADEAIDIVQLSPSEPYRLRIKGQILTDQEGNLIFDFGEFGTFKKTRADNFSVGGYWRPINPHPLDPLEDIVESIII